MPAKKIVKTEVTSSAVDSTVPVLPKQAVVKKASIDKIASDDSEKKKPSTRRFTISESSVEIVGGEYNSFNPEGAAKKAARQTFLKLAKTNKLPLSSDGDSTITIQFALRENKTNKLRWYEAVRKTKPEPITVQRGNISITYTFDYNTKLIVAPETTVSASSASLKPSRKSSSSAIEKVPVAAASKARKVPALPAAAAAASTATVQPQKHARVAKAVSGATSSSPPATSKAPRISKAVAQTAVSVSSPKKTVK